MSETIYRQLSAFITQKMRMSHVYQPVMLMSLLKNSGRGSARDIAREILKYDESQVEYYEHITKTMPGRVLSRHGVVKVEDHAYTLVGHEHLSADERNTLIRECQEKLDAYIEKRKDAMWKHRVQNMGYISGSLRYEILKRAQFHCELCGIPHDIRALEVDHILPRSKGGTDDLENLQALCYSCNAMKRNTDDTDFRALKATYTQFDQACAFCGIDKGRVVKENRLAFAVQDMYPVTPMHSLVIPKRHIPHYFDMGAAELKAVDRLLREMREWVLAKDQKVEGFNIGVNNGPVAGQTIFHLHLHLIPRRVGDVENPRGGVRHMIPGKGNY